MAPEKKTQDKVTLVRGADGALYLLTEDKTPLKLKRSEEKQINEILEDTQKKLTKVVEGIERCDFGGTRVVHVIVPEVVP